MEPYANELINYPFTIRIQTSHKKGESGKKRIFCEDIFTFDIETTSYFYESDLKPYLYTAGYDPDYWAGANAGALPYLWQFSINERYYYGRDIKDFRRVLDDFPPDMKVIIFIHNASFEWHFLDFLTWDKLFAKSEHKPIKFSCKEYPNIEFRCTLSLENRSLASWGESLGIPKLVGALDYNQMRTPLTPLKPLELDYGQRDLEVMVKGLQDELKTYGTIWDLPLTSTGKVRKVVKEILLADEDYIKYIKKLVPENPYQYRTSMQVYAGGYTHANRCYVGYTLYNDDGKHGGHYDYTSSYPYEMVVAKMPCTTWAWFGKNLPDPATFEEHAYKIHVSFKKIKSQLQNNYIQFSHTNCVNPTVDNGRLIKADECEMWITELDYEVISKAYKWEGEPKVFECWEARKDYLPIKFVEYVLQLFHDKTALKGVDETAYKLAKAFLNSLYGMCVTALLQAIIEWDPEDETWKTKHITDELITEHLEKLKKWKDKRYFLNYDWGVWISNGARCRLWTDLIIPYDKHVIYADTDSIFTNIAIDFTEYNNSINERIENVCRERGLDLEKTRPISKKGVRSYLGNLTTEEEWTEFRTLGAKRYVERWKCDSKLHLTVAGINKEAVTCLKDDIENFRDGLIFDKDDEDVSKLLHTYIDYIPDITFPDGYVSHQRRGVNLRPNGYKLKLDPTFDDIIKDVTYGLKNEQFENHLKGVWYDDIDELIEQAFESVCR